MAKLIKTLMMGRDQFNETVMAIPESPYEEAFDSTFRKSVMSHENCTLRITLRIFYRQINPNQITAPMMRVIAASRGIAVPPTTPVGMYPDTDKNVHLTKEWNGIEWADFIKKVKAQAQLWDGKFWLIPPDNFSLFDIKEGSWTAKSGSVTFRPNVKCEFHFEAAYSNSYAHQSIDVVNLLAPANFRSHSRLYSSDDATESSYSKSDFNMATINTKQPTVTHEIGHSLGLPHIGVSRNLAQCGLALVLDKNFHEDSIPALYKGGSNADVCYGTRATAGDINNIMGAGSAFSQENAKPWMDRLLLHLNLKSYDLATVTANLAKWKVSLTDVPPMSLSGY